MNDLLILVRYLGQAGESTATLEVLLRVTVLLLLAALAVAALRRSSAALRHLVWTLSLAGTLLIPAFFWAFPAWRWAILPGPEQSAPPAVASVVKESGETPSDAPPGIPDSLRTAEPVADASPVVSVRPVVTAAEQSPETASTIAQTVAESAALPAFGAHRTWSWPMLLAALWGLGAGSGLLWLAVSIAGAWHVARRTEPATDPCWRQLLNQLRAAGGSRRPIDVRECPLVSVPMTWGLRRPVILVPAGSAAWSEATKRSVLLHELGHIRRSDCLVHLLGRLACVAYWFHPLVWLAARQMRKTSERAADDAVLASHIAPPDYAEHLVAIAAQVRGLGWFSPVALPMASPSDLEGRVLAILDPERNHRRLKGRTCCVLVTAAVLLLVPCALLRLDRAEAAPTAKANESHEQPPAAKAAAADSSTATLGDVIEKVRRNEALFRDLDCTVRATWKFLAPKPEEERLSEESRTGPLAEKVLEKSYRAVTQGSRLYFQGEEATLLAGGKRPSEKLLAVCDGPQTVAIEEGNCVTIHQGRYEPAQSFPPHCWPLFYLQVNFPLSVYLQGTEAMKACPKVRHSPLEMGYAFEFNRVEAQRMGEEAVDGLACVKVRVKRWYRTSDPPHTEDLWLAADRNFQVALCRTTVIGKKQTVTDDESRVLKWRELAKGVWLPELIEWKKLRPEGPQENWSRRLVVEKAVWKPQLPEGLFHLPTVPAGLPKYVIGADGRLIDAPQYPTPVAAAPGTTLPAILKRLAEEEQRYERLEMTATNRYQMLNREGLDQSGVYMESITHERSIVMGDRLYFCSDQKATLGRGGTSPLLLIQQAYDGRCLRAKEQYAVQSYGEAKPHVDGSMDFSGADTMRLLRPHTLLFHDDRINSQRLAAFLASGWYDTVNHYPLTVEYVGDERIDGLTCHKLKCSIPLKGSPVPDNFFFLWLARDRNLLPIRHEWRGPKSSEKLPTGISYVEDLREIRAGMWCPFRTTELAHQAHSGSGLVANNIVLQWRRDRQVDKAVPDPKVDEKLFRMVEVPGGTEIAVRDDEGDFVGRFQQPTTGNMELSLEKLRAMQHDAGGNKVKPAAAKTIGEADGKPVLRPDAERTAPPELMKTLLDTNRHWLRPDPQYLSYTFSAALPARGSHMRYQVEYTAPNRVTVQGDHRRLYKGLVDDVYDADNCAWPPRRITLLQGVTLFGPLQELAMAPEGHALSMVGEEPVDDGRAWVLHLKATKGVSKEALDRWDERLRRRSKRSKYFYEFTPVKKEVDGESRAVIELKCAGEEGPGWKELVAAQQNNSSDIDWGGCRVQAVIREYRGQVRPVIVLGRTGRGSVTSISFLEGGVGNVTPKLGLGEGEQAFDEATYQKLKAQSSAPKPVLPMRVGCGVFGTWYGYSGGGADMDQLWVDKATGRVLREEGFYGGEPRFVVTYGDFAAIAGGGQVPRHIVVTLLGKSSDKTYPWVFDMKFQIVAGKTWLLKELKESQGEQQNVATATVSDASVSPANRRPAPGQPADSAAGPAHAPLPSALQAKGQEILAKVAEANRYWLDRPPPEVRSYRYDFGFIPGQRKTYEVANNGAASGVPRPGLSAASFLADVVAHPHSAVFRQIDVTPDEIAMTFTFTHMVPGHPDNGVTAIASGCFNHGVWEGTIVVDPKTFTPRRCSSGAYRETFFDYRELRPGHFVPLRVRIAGGLAFDLRFRVYEPGLWLFTASYWDDVRRKLGLAAQVDNVVVNGKPVRNTP